MPLLKVINTINLILRLDYYVPVTLYEAIAKPS
jgi:hypothetical protein